MLCILTLTQQRENPKMNFRLLCDLMKIKMLNIVIESYDTRNLWIIVSSIIMILMIFSRCSDLYYLSEIPRCVIFIGMDGMFLFDFQLIDNQYIDEIFILVSVISCYRNLRDVKGLYSHPIIYSIILVPLINYTCFRVLLVLMTIIMLSELNRCAIHIRKISVLLMSISLFIINYYTEPTELHNYIHIISFILTFEYDVTISMLDPVNRDALQRNNYVF